MKKAFGIRLRTLREGQGVTQVAMAYRLKVARQTYLDLESGKTEPRLTMIHLLAHVLDVDPILLLQPTKGAGLESYRTDTLLNEVSRRFKELE